MDNGPDLTGWATLITSISGPLSLAFIAWISRKVDKVAVTTTENLRQTEEVNHGVNGRLPRESTLSDDVKVIRAKQERDLPSLIEERGVKQILEALLIEMEKVNGGSKEG